MWDILGLVVGIVFAYLLLSLLATILQEIIASMLSMRGKFLLGAMIQLLELDWVDQSELAGTPEGEKIKALQAMRKAKRKEWTENIMKTRVYQKYMHKSGWITRLPSYLSAEQVISILQELMVDTPQEKEEGVQEQVVPDSDRIETDGGGTGELRDRGAGQILMPGANRPAAAAGGVERAAAAGVSQVRTVSAPKPKMLTAMKHVKLQNNLQKLHELTTQQQHVADVAPMDEVQKISRSITAPRDLAGQVKEIEEKVTEKFNSIKQEITTDFNDMMNRTSGWYKKRTQLVLFLIGLTIAVSFDADTFAMYRALSNNPEARQQVLALANQFVASGSAENFAPATQNGVNAEDQLLALRQQANVLIAQELESLESGLGLGRASFPEEVPAPADGSPVTMKQIVLFRGAKLIGWLVTALAISLGSTFWFDILKQLINIRNAGVKP